MTLQMLPRGKWLGARVKRVEDPRFLTGEAKYLADIALPGTVHVAFVRSPHGHARIRRIDTTGARAMPGVLAVFTADDVAALPPLASGLPVEGLKPTPQPVLAKDKVRFVGEAVAAVVAESRYLAEDAAEQVVVDYEPLPSVVDAERAMQPGAPILHEDLGSNIVYQKTTTLGDVETVFAQADRVFRRRLHTNRFVAAPMETRGCVSVYERASARLTFYSSTQMPHMLRLFLSLFLGIPEHQVRVISPEVGGGFGQKMTIYPEEVAVAYFGKVLGRPVKWVEDRRENLAAATHAKEQIIELEAAVRSDGRILGLKARLIGDGGAYSFNTASALIEPLAGAGLIPGVYDIQHYQHDVIAVCTNKSPVGAFRAVGWTAAQTARELFFDEIARELNLDPTELRRRNVIGSEQFPYTTCTGMVYDSGTYRESLERALELVGYEELRRRQAELREQGRYLGIGISLYVEPTAWGSEIALQAGFPFPSHDNATVTIDPSGKVRVAVSVHSHGQGHETTLAQVAAEILGVALDDVVVEHGDTDRAPWGMGTYASRSAVIGGGMVALAAQEVRDKVLRVASRLLEVAPEDLDIQDGTVSVKGAPDRALSMFQVAFAAYLDNRVRVEGEEPLLSATKFYDPRATYSNGCIVTVCEVDVATGLVHLEKVIAVEDCGTMLNPMIVEGQVMGAIGQGIGGALYEEMAYDERGQLLTDTFASYLLPSMTEVPPLTIEHLETPSPVTLGGIKGIGEGGLLATPASVAGAVLDALAPFDARIEHLPLTPERIVEAVEQRRGR
jgi:carbon-monoxide dehydrogenase large subunit